MRPRAPNQAEINARMLPWTGPETDRFVLRQALLVRRGWPDRKATAGADRLALRDQQGDDRHVCIECANCRGMACIKRWPVLDVLQRCPHFTPEGPTS